jgi:putative nucleotidyltransferase with HDIG domain
MQNVPATDIQRAVRNATPYVFRVEGAAPDSFSVLDGILETFLAELGQEKIQEVLSYCVKELVLNAEKANAKRIYFDEHHLAISKKEDYEAGMKGFHRELSENLAHFLEKLQERQMAIEVAFHSTEGSLKISVKNNAALAPMEDARIKERIARARTLRSFSDALETSVDHTEGAGLGIMILLQFLRSIGLGEEALSFSSDKGNTTSSILIPISEVQLDQIRVLSEELVRNIETLPHFPESVTTLVRLTENENAKVADISSFISRDPTLTAELLKHVNSAYYGLPSRVNGIPQAVKLIGLRSLHQLLYSFGFHMLLDHHHPQMKSLWQHSLQTAFYAFHLARDVKRRPEIIDDAYVAGILHDLGFIAITTLHTKTKDRMRRFCMDKNIPLWVLERFSFGMKHADIGALIAQKWNFPDQLIEGIKYHHDPLPASGRHKDIVFCVYLANAMCDLERGLISYQQLDATVLRDFGISTEAGLRDLAAGLKSSFDRRQSQLDSL